MRRDHTCRFGHLVDRHFDLRIRPAEERSLRDHLGECAACRERYARHLAISGVDPRAADSRDRLAVGLGLRRRRARVGPALAVAAACAVVASMIALRSREPGDGDFAERGRSAATRLFVYRVPPGQRPSIAGHQIARDDELAFAYENGAGRKYLLVFAVDEHRHVYWYHPAWTDDRATPVAVPISTAPGVHELPEAIGHTYDGSELVLYAVFTDQPRSVREMEERMSGRAPGEPITGIPAEDQHRTALGVIR